MCCQHISLCEEWKRKRNADLQKQLNQNLLNRLQLQHAMRKTAHVAASTTKRPSADKNDTNLNVSNKCTNALSPKTLSATKLDDTNYADFGVACNLEQVNCSPELVDSLDGASCPNRRSLNATRIRREARIVTSNVRLKLSSTNTVRSFLEVNNSVVFSMQPPMTV